MAIVTTSGETEQFGTTPIVPLLCWSLGGVTPSYMGLGPSPATARALARVGMEMSALELTELNEAFAPQVLAVVGQWGSPTPTNGSPPRAGISLGHPAGAIGSWMLASLARDLHRREGRLGLLTVCIGGGQGLAAVFERATS